MEGVRQTQAQCVDILYCVQGLRAAGATALTASTQLTPTCLETTQTSAPPIPPGKPTSAVSGPKRVPTPRSSLAMWPGMCDGSDHSTSLAMTCEMCVSGSGSSPPLPDARSRLRSPVVHL